MVLIVEGNCNRTLTFSITPCEVSQAYVLESPSKAAAYFPVFPVCKSRSGAELVSQRDPVTSCPLKWYDLLNGLNVSSFCGDGIVNGS
jgi:hypothetical protein